MEAQQAQREMQLQAREAVDQRQQAEMVSGTLLQPPPSMLISQLPPEHLAIRLSVA